jgi:hypothetical protein
MAYPGETGTPVFACIHSTGMSEAENVRLELTATSNNILDFLMGKGTLAKESYEGPAPGSIVAFTAPLSRASESYTVRAKLYQNDVLIDDVSVPYECSTFSDDCIPTRTVNLLIGGVFVAVVIGGIFLLRRRMTMQK